MKRWITLFACLITLSAFGGEESDPGYDLFIYHGKAQKDYQNGGSKNHGRTFAYTYIGNMSSWAVENGATITYRGNEPRIVNRTGGASCELWPADPGEWVFTSESTLSKGVVHNAMFDFTTSPRTNCVQKSDAGLGDDTHARLGVVAVRRNTTGYTRATFPDVMKAEHERQGLTWQINWLTQDQVESAAAVVFGATPCSGDIIVSTREKNELELYVSVLVKEGLACGSSTPTCPIEPPIGTVTYGMDCISTRITIGGRKSIHLLVDTPEADLRDSSVLLIPQDSGVGIHKDANQQIDQVYTGSHLAVITPIQTSGTISTEFKIEVFEAVNPYDANQPDYLHVLDASPVAVSTMEIERVDAVGETVRISADWLSRSDDLLYDWDTNIESIAGRDGWTLTDGPSTGAQRVHRKTERIYTTGGIEYLEVIDWVLDPTNTSIILERTEKVYRNFATSPENFESVIGEDINGPVTTTTTQPSVNDWRLISQIEGFNGKTETTTMEYYTTADGAAKEGRLKSAQYPDGNWMKQEFDAQGRLTKVINSYKNNAFTTADSANRVTEHDFTPLGADPGTNTTIPRTVTQSVAGQVISKSFTLVLTGKTQRIRAATPTSAWNDPANLVTTDYYDFGELVVTELPDGQIRTREVTYILDQEILTTATGVPDALPITKNSVVIEGSKTVTTTHEELGYRVSTYTYRVTPTGEILLRGAIDSQWDDEYRPQRTDYVDGTFTTTSYACCGIASMTDKEGVTTFYEYDELRRRTQTTRSGVTTHTEYDGLDRVTFRYQTPDNDFNNSLGKATAAPEYNEIGEMEKSYDAVGRLTEMDRSVAGGIVTNTTTLPGGATSISKTYADGTPIETLGTATRPMTTTISWDSNGQRISEQAYTANANEFSRSISDFLGRTIQTERPSPTGTGVAVTQMVYETGTGRMIEAIDPSGLSTLYAYNDLGEREFMAVDVNGNGQIDLNSMDVVTETVISYEDYLFNAVTYPTLKVTTTQYQEANSATPTVVSESWSDHDGLNQWSESFGQLSHYERVRDVPNATVTTTQTAPDGSSTVSVTVNGLAQSTTFFDANAVQLGQMTYGYDDWNRQNTVTDVGTGTTTTTFHADSSVNTITSPDPDGAGPQTAQVTTMWTSGINSLGYTAAGGRIEKMTYPDNTTFTREYFPTGELQKQEGSRQYPVEYTYDDAGRMKTMKTWQDFTNDTGSAITTWNYNDAGMLTSKRYDDNKGPDYAYDIRGNLTTRTWARFSAVPAVKLTTLYTYDAQSRLTNIDYPNAPVATPSVTNTYDRIGRIIQVQDASGTRTYDHGTNYLLEAETYTAGLLNGWKLERGYDSLRRPDDLDLFNGAILEHDVAYGYDAASRLSTVTGHGKTNTYTYQTNRPLLDQLDQGGVQTVDWTHDTLNRLTSIATDNGTTTLSSHTYDYNDANQRTKATLADGSYWEYTYDALGQVTGGVKKDSGGTPLNGYDFGYTYDDIGNRKASVINGKTTNYVATLLNMYSSVTRPAFANVQGDRANTNTTIEVDVLGDAIPAVEADYNNLLWHKEVGVTNLVSEVEITATEGGNSNSIIGSLYTPSGASSPTYDDDGNLTQDHLWNYTWNSENRLVVQEHRTDVTLTPLNRKKMEYTYDSQGRRVERKIYEEISSSWVLQEDLRFVYDGWNLIAEINAIDDIFRDYTWGMDVSGSMQGAGGVGGLLSVDDGTTVALTVYDGNGNVMGYSDSSTGLFIAEYEYDPFGRKLNSLGTHAESFVHQFSTKYQDEESGYYYYGFRYYDPETGRWLNRDPIEEQGGYNLYGFVDNDGVNDYDLLGNISVSHAALVAGDCTRLPGRARQRCGERYLRSNPREVFDKWLELELELGRWWSDIPKCPRRITCSSERAGRASTRMVWNVDESDWNQPVETSDTVREYHPNAEYEMRSLPVSGGHGNQCMYTRNGNVLEIITDIPDAGSLDWATPQSVGGVIGHVIHDVRPFELARSLSRERDYYRVRGVWVE